MKRLTIEQAVSIRRFPSMVPLHIRPRGDMVAYTVMDPLGRTGSTGQEAEISGCSIQVQPLPKGDPTRLSHSESADWGPRWSPDGRRLAWFSRAGAETRLCSWSPGEGPPRHLAELPVLSLWGMEPIQWTPDSRRVVCRALPAGGHGQSASPAGVARRTYLEYIPEANRPLREEMPSWSDRYLCDIATVEAETGRVARLCQDVRPFRIQLSPDGLWLALLEPVARRGLHQFECELRIIPTNSLGEARVALTGLKQLAALSLTFSPSSRYLACASAGAGGSELWLADLETGESRNLIPEAMRISIGQFPPRWLPDESALFSSAGGALWRVPLHGGGPISLTGGWGWHVHDLIGPVGDPQVWLPDGESLLVRVVGKELQQAIGQVNLVTGGRTVRWEADRLYMTTVNGDVCRSTGTILFESQ